MASLTQRTAVARLWGHALDLVFPPRCVSCNRFGAFICGPCVAGAARAEPPRCPRCWMPASSHRAELAEREPQCRRCRWRRPAFTAVRAAFVYEGAAREAVHALKFRGVSAVAPRMASLMTELLFEWQPRVGAIVPVPLAGRRRRERGYNQSELLAKEVSRIAGIPLERRALVRRRPTAPQARQTGEEARRRNVAGAFAPGSRPAHGGILLIDDVVTTGATLDGCARVLISEGAGPVFALTFARED